MRAGLEKWLNRVWYQSESAPWYLRMLVPPYRSLSSFNRKKHIRNRAEDLSEKCIIVVGNITVGGTGKTPLIIHLAEILKANGLKPGVISRGYGRKDRQQRLVAADSTVSLVGDEPFLIAQRTGVPVVVDRNRVHAARVLFDQGVDVVLSDDGLQHLSLPRKLEICVIDGERGLGNGMLLPAGPLREDAGRLAEVDTVVLNGSDPDQQTYFQISDDDDWQRLDIHATQVFSLTEKISWRLSQFSGCKVTAVAGISNPARFFNLLRQSRIEVEEHVFPDHHEFTDTDFLNMPADLPIIMTEKDAVKCRSLRLENAWYLGIDAQLPRRWESAFVERVQHWVRYTGQVNYGS